MIAIGRTALAALACSVLAMPVTAADTEKVIKKCKACHTLEQGDTKKKAGPNLFGMYGSKAGSVKGFKYAKGFREAKETIGVWDAEKLDSYLTNPTAFLKANGGSKTKMTFRLKKAEERAAAIEFLKTLK